VALLFGSCVETSPNKNLDGRHVLFDHHLFMDEVDLSYRDTTYVPIYSEIYSKTRDVHLYMTATLSIRNTSLRDSLFIESIEYFDSAGDSVRQYLDKVLVLEPRQSIEYVIEQSDHTGGTGAHFVIAWGTDNPRIQPIFQGVMISTYGQIGLSFITEGVSISERPLEVSASNPAETGEIPEEASPDEGITKAE
jgi:hypothetical protein